MSLVDEVTSRVLDACRNSRVIEKARIAAADTLAVAAAAYHLARVKPSYPVLGSGPGVILGSKDRSYPAVSVGVNGFLSHSLELDDWLPQGFVHAGSVVVPSALIAGLELDVSLERFLEAVAAGYQAGYMIGGLLGRRHYAVWHTTSTAGIAASAVASGVVRYGCREDVVGRLVVLGLNYMGGLWSLPKGDPSVKPASAMHASASGYLLSLLGQEGFRSIDVLGDACRAFQGECNGLPGGFALDLNGYKLYPSCRHTHPSIDAVLEILKTHRFAYSDVENLLVETYSDAVEKATRSVFPPTAEDARFNLGYLVSVAVVYRDVWFDTIEKGLSDPRVRELYRKVTVKADKSFDTGYPNKTPARITVELRDGTRLATTVEYPRGTPETGVSGDEILEKAGKLSLYTGDQLIEEMAGNIIRMSPGSRLAEAVPYASSRTA